MWAFLRRCNGERARSCPVNAAADERAVSGGERVGGGGEGRREGEGTFCIARAQPAGSSSRAARPRARRVNAARSGGVESETHTQASVCERKGRAHLDGGRRRKKGTRVTTASLALSLTSRLRFSRILLPSLSSLPRLSSSSVRHTGAFCARARHARASLAVPAAAARRSRLATRACFGASHRFAMVAT